MAFYVICDDDSRHESMTKEQILAAITQAINTGKIGNCDTGFVTKIKELNSGGYVSMWVGTQAEYNALATKPANCICIFTDDTTFADLEKVAVEAKNAAETAERVSNEAKTSADSKNAVAYSRTLATGEKIGAITIDGTTTNIYAPEPMRRVYSADFPLDLSVDNMQFTFRVETKTNVPKLFIVTLQCGSNLYSVAVDWFAPTGAYMAGPIFTNGTINGVATVQYSRDQNGCAVFASNSTSAVYIRRIVGYA